MKAEPGPGGAWVVEGEGVLGSWDIDGTRYVRPEYLYAGQPLQLCGRVWVFTGFEDIVNGEFAGAALDLLPWADVEPLPGGGRQEATSSVAWMANDQGIVRGRTRLQFTVLCRATVQFMVREVGRPDQRLIRYF